MVCAAIGAPLFLLGSVITGVTGGDSGTPLVTSAVGVACAGIGLGRRDVGHTIAGSPERRTLVRGIGSCAAIAIAGLIVNAAAVIAYLAA